MRNGGFNFAHIGVIVPDLEKASNYYQDMFGFKVEKSAENKKIGIKMEFLGCGNGSIEFICRSGRENEDVGGAIDHISFIVKDFAEGLKILQERGIPEEAFDVKERPKGGLHAFFFGPNGEKLQLLEDPEKGKEGEFILEHIGIRVKSIQEAKKLYVDTLKFQVLEERTFLQQQRKIMFLDPGKGALIELIEDEQEERPNPVEHFALLTDDIAYWHKELSKAGVEMLDKEPRLTASGASYNAKVKAENGEIIELLQPLQ